MQKADTNKPNKSEAGVPGLGLSEQLLTGARQRLVGLLPVRTSFACGRNIRGAGALKDIFCLLGPGRIVGMHGEQDSAFLDPAFVALGFVFGNAHANESSRDAANRAAYADSGESSHDRSCRNERADARNGQRANTGQPTERSADYGASCGTGCGSLGRLRVFLNREVFRALIFGEQNGDVGIAETLRPQEVDCVFHVALSAINSECCCVFSSHYQAPSRVIVLNMRSFAACRMADTRLGMAGKCLSTTIAREILVRGCNLTSAVAEVYLLRTNLLSWFQV